jgi:hypothetical protein
MHVLDDLIVRAMGWKVGRLYSMDGHSPPSQPNYMFCLHLKLNLRIQFDTSHLVELLQIQSLLDKA